MFSTFTLNSEFSLNWPLEKLSTHCRWTALTFFVWIVIWPNHFYMFHGFSKAICMHTHDLGAFSRFQEARTYGFTNVSSPLNAAVSSQGEWETWSGKGSGRPGLASQTGSRLPAWPQTVKLVCTACTSVTCFTTASCIFTEWVGLRASDIGVQRMAYFGYKTQMFNQKLFK